MHNAMTFYYLLFLFLFPATEEAVGAASRSRSKELLPTPNCCCCGWLNDVKPKLDPNPVAALNPDPNPGPVAVPDPNPPEPAPPPNAVPTAAPVLNPAEVDPNPNPDPLGPAADPNPVAPVENPNPDPNPEAGVDVDAAVKGKEEVIPLLPNVVPKPNAAPAGCVCSVPVSACCEEDCTVDEIDDACALTNLLHSLRIFCCCSLRSACSFRSAVEKGSGS